MSIYGNSIYNYRDNYILNEAYIGKTPILQEVEKEIGLLRKNLPDYNSDINRTSHVLKINRLIEKQFKMDVFSLIIDKTKSPDAYTYSIINRIDLAKEYSSLRELISANQTDGYYFKPKNNICVLVHISWALLNSNEFTDAEIVAILLHEIGHNFNATINNKLYLANRETVLSYNKYMIEAITLAVLLSIFTFGLYIPTLIDIIKNFKSSKKYMNNKKNRKRELKTQKKKQNKLRGWLSGVKARKADKKDFLEELEARKSGDVNINDYIAYLDSPDSGFNKEANKKSLSRIDEIMSDKFAGIYGYGPEQASSLLKLEEYMTDAARKIYEDNNKKAIKANEKYEAAFRKLHDYDVHPQIVQRAYTELNTLKREVEKDDLDPKMKDIILDQINQVQKVIDEMISTSEKLNNSQNAGRLYNAYINDNFPEATAKEIEDELDEAFDKVLEEEINKAKKKNNKK